MKVQLASAFVIAAVACGGRGEEEPAARVDSTTDLSQTEGSARVDGNVDATPPIVGAAVDDNIDAPRPIEEPLPLDGSLLRARPTKSSVPVGGTTEAHPNEDQWQARAPKQYVISTCGYGLGPPSCSVEAVDNGQLVSRSNRFLPTEPWVVVPIDDGQDPVASLFDEIGRSIEGCTTSFQFDPVYAYPSQVYFDCGQEGFGTRVTCFEPDTLDTSVCQ